MSCRNATTPVYGVEEKRLRIVLLDNPEDCSSPEIPAATGAFFNGDFACDGVIDFSAELFE
jgi:hypothetical protein